MNRGTSTEIIQSIRENTLDAACKLLASYEGDMREYLAEFTCALCGISVEEMRDKNAKDSLCAQVRWLYWYAYRYMTGDSFASIQQKEGNGVVISAIAQGVNKMSRLIDGRTIWTRRWNDLKRIINIINNTEES